VLALSSAQARRPRSAAGVAVQFAVRMHKSGLDLVIVADGEPVGALVDPLGPATVVDAVAAAWIESSGRPSDLLVLPGGQNGALATTRTAKQAGRIGATIAVVADARSVSAVEAAGQGLGLVTGRGATPMNEILVREA
jgi:hypothetical protein